MVSIVSLSKYYNLAILKIPFDNLMIECDGMCLAETTRGNISFNLFTIDSRFIKIIQFKNLNAGKLICALHFKLPELKHVLYLKIFDDS